MFCIAHVHIAKKNWWYFSIQGLQKLHVSILWKGPLNKRATSRITKVHLWPITSLSVQDQSGGENYRMAATVVVIYDITFYRVADFMRNNFKSSNNHYFALFGRTGWRWPLKTFFFLSPSPPDSPPHSGLWCDTLSKWVRLYPMLHYGHGCRISSLIMVPINFWRNSDLFKKKRTFF